MFLVRAKDGTTSTASRAAHTPSSTVTGRIFGDFGRFSPCSQRCARAPPLARTPWALESTLARVDARARNALGRRGLPQPFPQQLSSCRPACALPLLHVAHARPSARDSCLHSPPHRRSNHRYMYNTLHRTPKSAPRGVRIGAGRAMRARTPGERAPRALVRAAVGHGPNPTCGRRA